MAVHKNIEKKIKNKVQQKIGAPAANGVFNDEQLAKVKAIATGKDNAFGVRDLGQDLLNKNNLAIEALPPVPFVSAAGTGLTRKKKGRQSLRIDLNATGSSGLNIPI